MNESDRNARLCKCYNGRHSFSTLAPFPGAEFRTKRVQAAIATVVEQSAKKFPEKLKQMIKDLEYRSKLLRSCIKSQYENGGVQVDIGSLSCGPRDERMTQDELFWTQGVPLPTEPVTLGFLDYGIQELGSNEWEAQLLSVSTDVTREPQVIERDGPYASPFDAWAQCDRWRLHWNLRVGTIEGSSYLTIPEVPDQCRPINAKFLAALLRAQCNYLARFDNFRYEFCRRAADSQTEKEYAILALALPLLEVTHPPPEENLNEELLLCWLSLGYALLPMDVLVGRLFCKFKVRFTTKSLEKHCRRLGLVSLHTPGPQARRGLDPNWLYWP